MALRRRRLASPAPHSGERASGERASGSLETGERTSGLAATTDAGQDGRFSRLTALVALPAAAWYLVMLVAPLATAVIVSAGERGEQGGFVPRFTFSAYGALLDPIYTPVLRTTLFLAVGGTIGCILLAYPLAYLLATRGGRRRTLLLVLVIIPFWTSFLIRTYAWLTILSPTGPLDTAFTALGLQMPRLVDGPPGVFVGIVYNYLPLAVFPVYVALERLDTSLVEASKDLGAGRWGTFRQVTWPLTLPGVATATLLVFVPLTGEWVIPSILGGGKSYYLGTFMANQVTDSRNWPLGSAAAVVLIAVMLVVVAVYLRIVRGAPDREVSLL